MTMQPAPLKMAGDMCCRLAAAPSGLAVARRGPAEIFLPTTGGPVTLTSAATPPWAFGPWTAIATPSDGFYLTGWLGVWTNVPFTFTGAVVEFAFGDAKTPLDAFRANHAIMDLTGDASGWTNLCYPSRPVLCPHHETLYARLATGASGAQTVDVLAVGFDGQLPTFEHLPSNLIAAGYYYPSDNDAGTFTVQHGGSWTWGTPAHLPAAPLQDELITHVLPYPTTWQLINPAGAYQVGHGGPGAEVWCATIPFGRTFAPATIWPPLLIRATETVAIRATWAGGTYNQPVLLKFARIAIP